MQTSPPRCARQLHRDQLQMTIIAIYGLDFMAQCLCREHASEISVQILSKMPYDEDMKRKYAKHLKTSERYAL